MDRTIYPTTIRYFQDVLASGRKAVPILQESPARILLAGHVREISEDKTTITIYDGTGSISLNSRANDVFSLSQNDIVRVHILMSNNTATNLKTLFCEKLASAEALLVHFLSAMNALRLTDDKTGDNELTKGYGTSIAKDAGNDFLSGFGGGQAAFY